MIILNQVFFENIIAKSKAIDLFENEKKIATLNIDISFYER